MGKRPLIGGAVIVWLAVAIGVATLAAMAGFAAWLGRVEGWAAEPSPLVDPAFRGPAWHPDDPGVIDLRQPDNAWSQANGEGARCD